MIKVTKEGILLSKSQLEFENEAVMNPAAIIDGGTVHLIYRAVKEGNFSSLGYCRLEGPLKVDERWDEPILSSEMEYESHGLEDPRIVKIEECYYLTYTVYDGISALGALALSRDMKMFKKHGIITPMVHYDEFVSLVGSDKLLHKNYIQNQLFYEKLDDKEGNALTWDKDVVFFPRKINGQLVFLHRIRPGIQIVTINTLNELSQDFWLNYLKNFRDHIVLDPIFPHESSYIGSGCPPIETEYGWLLIYHGAADTEKGMYYTACAAMLDLNIPSKVLARLPYPLFRPDYDWEENGIVDHVVFPTGAVVFNERLFIYYGAADSRIACASIILEELITELMSYAVKDETNTHSNTSIVVSDLTTDISEMWKPVQKLETTKNQLHEK
ncbi:MAG: pesticidal protein Cry7Aa [Bacteroidales bacterium]|nr:pesticidal protein Cry7Aa [Bacteroidales bacterium]